MAEQLFEPITDRLRQGDIFETLPFSFLANGDGGEPAAKITTQSQRAMLLNQSCDVDKGYKKLVVVPVLPLSSLSGGQQDLVRKNRLFSALYISAYRDVLPESFISFLEPMTVDRSFLERQGRIVSLSDQGRRALYVQFTRWISRWQLAELSCPGCGAKFNPAATLPVENT